MTLIERYKKDLRDKALLKDEAQERAIKVIQETLDNLVSNEKSFLKRLCRILGLKCKPVQGVYLWGGVGRGKTYLMNLFYESLPFKQKKRHHFHHFMMQVHEQLKKLQGEKDPLNKIAERWSKEFIVLCFDEFYVTDIADAMLLGKLLESLFQRGITLIATSNIEPDSLYPNGLQRDKFLPAITLIKQHTTVLNLDNGVDYRLLYLTKEEIFYSPLSQSVEDKLEASFKHLSFNQVKSCKKIIIQEREIECVAIAEGVIWFEFSKICGQMRHQYDYIEIARVYHTVIVSGVYLMTDADNNVAKRFIMMIDEFYEHNVTLIMSSESAFYNIYQGEKLSFEFKRTISRLQEMSSQEYLAKPHIV